MDWLLIGLVVFAAFYLVLVFIQLRVIFRRRGHDPWLHIRRRR